MMLPAGFAALERFVAEWAGTTAAERDRLRTVHGAQARQEFYEVMTPLLASALALLDATPLAEHDERQRTLMLLTLSYAHVALAVEVQGPDEAKHAINRQRLPISHAPADA
jgi:hypothetical protein